MTSSISKELERLSEWTAPPLTANPFRLGSSVDGPADVAEIDAAWPGGRLPADLIQLWRSCRSATLFEDQDYGQWGLRILSPAQSALRTTEERGRRPKELSRDDIVIGEFLGDLELLILAPSAPGDQQILVALPLDPRTEWYEAASSIAEFLERYRKHNGDKYWEN